MIQVEFNKKNVNPFQGLKNCLTIYQKNLVSPSLLEDAWNEVKDDEEKKKMFFSVLFSVGDVTNRQHNIFNHKTVDNGGFAGREEFYYIINWMFKNHKDQFVKFLNAGLFNEYSCFDQLLRNRVVTSKGKTTIVKQYTMLRDPEYREILSDYFVKVINGNNPFNKMLIAKFLSLPRLGKRSKHKRMQSETFYIMKDKAEFLKLLSDKMGWNYSYIGNYANFIGYRNFRKQYNMDLESVLFSTGKIKEFDKEQFLDWLNKLPAQARFRVKNRLLYSIENDKPKWGVLANWYNEWERFKEQKQQEQRILEEKVRQNTASDEDVLKLKQVKKEAKVTTGATTFVQLYKDILAGTIDKLKMESFANKVNLAYNTLVITDDSGSMSGAPFNFATFLTSVCLAKNPDDTGRDLIGMFNTSARLYSCIDAKSSNSSNSFMRRLATKIAPEPFINPEKSLYENYIRINNFMNAVFHGGGTHINCIPRYFGEIAKNNPEILDELHNYPIWTIISDGEWNNAYSPESSLGEFFRDCEMYLGYKPYIIAIDVCEGWYKERLNPSRFAGIDNFMYVPSSPEMIEQILTNFKDMDTYDVYTPLQTIYRSNRYEIVRKNVI